MNILITGGSSGIGKYLAENFCKKNTVIICSSAKKRILKKKNSTIVDYRCDVSNEKSVRNFSKLLKKKLNKIDVIINCAGTYGAIGSFDELNFKQWKKAIEINFFGTFLICKYFVEFLQKSKVKKIINFSGGGAFNSFPNYSSYACSKAAVVRFSETVAEELKSKKIYVNCIAPGFVSTRIHNKTINSGSKKAGNKFYLGTLKKLKTGGTPLEKIQRCISFLLLKKTNFTGKTISVNFDPWEKKEFMKNIFHKKNLDALTMRRVNLKKIQTSV